MSTYRDFYTLSGEGAYPINSYRPLSLGTATGNPANWDPTTGIWTDPEGNVWLQTGFTSTAISTYPDAAKTELEDYTSFAFLSGSGNGDGNIAWDGQYYWTAANTGGSNTVTAFNADFSAAGITKTFNSPSNFPAADYISQGLHYDIGSSTLHWIVCRNGTPGLPEVRKYNLGTNTAEASVTLGSTTTATNLYGMCTDNRGNIFASTLGTNTVREWNSAGVLQNTYTAAGATQTNCVAFDGVHFYISDYGNNNIYQYDAGFAGAANFSFASGVSGGQRDITFNNREKKLLLSDVSVPNFRAFTGTSTSSDEVGDGTPRTSTDTGQPLFLRIK